MNVSRVIVILLIIGLVHVALAGAGYAATSSADSLRDLQSAPRLAAYQPSNAVKCPSTYIVRYGETLNSIAQRCNVSVAALMRANGLRSLRIWPGQRLYIPSARVQAAPQPTPPMHRPLAP